MAVVDQVLRDGHRLVRSQEDAVAQQLRNRDCLYHLPRISAKGTPARIDRATRNPAGKPCPAVLQLSEPVTDERTAAAFSGGLNHSRESVRPPAVRIFRRLPLTSHIHSGRSGVAGEGASRELCMLRTVGVVAGTFAVFGLAAAASAQTALGTLRGVVLDQQGAALPGATVTVKQVETGTVQTTPTSSEGQFFLPNLRPGKYELT